MKRRRACAKIYELGTNCQTDRHSDRHGVRRRGISCHRDQPINNGFLISRNIPNRAEWRLREIAFEAEISGMAPLAVFAKPIWKM
jgi:uncharacterized protein YgiB involved in biofilm formation